MVGGRLMVENNALAYPVGCHCWPAQQCGNTGGQATRGTRNNARRIAPTAVREPWLVLGGDRPEDRPLAGKAVLKAGAEVGEIAEERILRFAFDAGFPECRDFNDGHAQP